MIIASNQINVIRKSYNEIFINDLQLHIEENFPEISFELGKSNTIDFIMYGIRKASSFGFNTEKSIFQFMNLLLTLGPEFEKLKELNWIKPILYDLEGDESERISDMISLTERYLKNKENAA